MISLAVCALMTLAFTLDAARLAAAAKAARVGEMAVIPGGLDGDVVTCRAVCSCPELPA
jgi:hypothetical protein